MSKALKEAIEKNDGAAARKALKTVKDLSRKLPKASAPLDYACSQGADAVVEALLEAGAPLQGHDGYVGNHPFCLAAEAGHAAVLERFAGREVPEDAVAHAIWIAVMRERAGAVTSILAHFKPRLTDQLVEVASWWTSGELLDALLAAGADINEKNDGAKNFDMAGWRAMHSAAHGGYAQSIEMLAKRGADVSVRDRIGRTPLMLLASQMPGLDQQARERAEMTPERKALMAKLEAEGQLRKRGDRDPADGFAAARLLLKLGADGAATDDWGNDALMYYQRECRREREEQNKKFVELLQKAGAVGGGATWALFEAIANEDLKAAKRAIDEGADVDRQAPGGCTPLVMTESVEMLELLLQSRANPNKATTNSTPLVSAARGGEMEMVKRLLAAGADLHAIEPRAPGDEYLANAYSAAMGNSKNDVAEYLKSLGAGKPKLATWKPLEAGVETWNDFSEILVKGTVADIANGLANMINGKAVLSAYGKQHLPGKRAFVVYRPKGMAWCNVIRIAPRPLRFEEPEVMIGLCGEIAKACDAPVISVEYNDTAGAADVRRYEPDGSSERDESQDFEMLEEMVGAMGDEAPEWAKEKLATLEAGADSAESLPEIAKREKFVVGALGLDCEPGRKLDVDFSGYPAEAFDGVAFVSRV